MELPLAALAILQPDARTTARLAGALGQSHRVVVRGSWESLERLIADGEVDGCVVDADHPGREDALRQLTRLRERHPRLAIIVYVDDQRADGYFDLGGLGADGLVTSAAGKGQIRSDVDQAFARARGRAVARVVEHRFPDPFPTVLAWAVAHAAADPNVEQLAAAQGLSRRGLRNALGGPGLLAPFHVLLWGRLLLAASRLAEDGRGTEEVAFSLGYATASSLARAMRQHTGHTPTQIVEGGGMRLVLDSLLAGRGGGSSPDSRRGSSSVARIVATAAFLVAVGGCATLGGAHVDRGGIDEILAAPGIEQMHVGVLAVDARTGRTLYAHDDARKFVPASNQKILVTAAAMTMLGPDWRYRTEVFGVGHVGGYDLHGDLVLVANGDPTLSGRFWPSGEAALHALADSLRATGLGHVDGSLVIDASAWDSTTVGPTWEVEDLRYDYGSTGGAFAIDEGEVEVVLEAGASVGSPARLTWTPAGTEGFVRSLVVTVSPDSVTRVIPDYYPESRYLELRGTVVLGSLDTLHFAQRDPVRQASAALGRAIQRAGIELEGGGKVEWTAGEWIGGECPTGAVADCGGATRLVALESPPLSEIIAGILKPSQNWMTEQLLRTLAASFGGQGSWSEGIDVVEAFLFEHVGVDTLDVAARDGSGLSAYDLVTPRALVRVLRHMRDQPFGDAYRSALAQPGEEDSTLEDRLIDLRGRVFAKTGSISNVNSLSGYLVREDGSEVVFSILTNASGLPSSYVRTAIDDIVRVLAR